MDVKNDLSGGKPTLLIAEDEESKGGKTKCDKLSYST